MAYFDEEEQLRDRFECIKEKLEFDMHDLRAALQNTRIKMLQKSVKNGTAASSGLYTGSTRNSCLDPQMIAFSKNVADRRASSALATQYNAQQILDKQMAEEGLKNLSSMTIRQMVTVDDRFLNHPPVVKTREERPIKQAGHTPVKVALAEVSTTDDLMAPPLLRVNAKVKARHEKSYRKLTLDVNA